MCVCARDRERRIDGGASGVSVRGDRGRERESRSRLAT